MRKKLSILLALVFLFASVLPAFAGEVRTFGFDDQRHRENTVSGTALFPVYYHDGGKSYSQPLILPGSKWGLDGKVVVTVENNVLNGYLVPDTPPARFSEISPAWSVQLDGDTPTTSHPTLVEKGGKKYIYIGTYSPALDIVDITDFNNVNQQSLISRESPQATDITSAPLVLNWKGHEIVVNTTGNSGKVFIITDPLDENKMNDFYINVGTGRTSSSPAPVANGTAFAVGLDGGFQQHGELRIYYLDDILSEDGSGKVIKGSETTRVAKSLPSGLVASFAVDGDMLFFGDSDSNVYSVNVNTQTGWVNTGSAGTFSNRSPALTASRVYFPVTNYGSPDAQGKLVAIDRSDGSTAFALPMEYNGENMGRTMTAPVVMRAGSQAQIVAGTGLGDLAFIDPVGGSMVGAYNISKVTGDANYASGVTGEISAWDNLGVTTSEQGVIIWQLIPAGNLKATSINLGVPQGQKAIPGTEYTAKVVFENQSNYTYSSVPVAVLHGQYAAILYDEAGQVLPTKTINGKQVQVADFGLTAKRTFTCKWHPAAQAKDGLNGIINRDEIGKVYQEITYDDNAVHSDIEVKYINLGVKNLYIEPNPGTPGEESTAYGTAYNDYNEAVNDVPIILYVDKTYQGSTVVSLPAATEAGPGEADFETKFPTPSAGEHKIEVVINPARLDQTSLGRSKLEEWGLQIPDTGMNVIPEGYDD